LISLDRASTILPLELVDRATGSKVWVIMKSGQYRTLVYAEREATRTDSFIFLVETEFTGTLIGFDDYVSEYTNLLIV
jgi:U6 snRNA-associated Sm-like protein LSm5